MSTVSLRIVMKVIRTVIWTKHYTIPMFYHATNVLLILLLYSDYNTANVIVILFCPHFKDYEYFTHILVVSSRSQNISRASMDTYKD